MPDLFTTLSIYGPRPVVCLDCASFGGSAHDKGGFLLVRRSGYCNALIGRGDWRVLQRIDVPRQCADFEEASEAVKAQRRKAIAFYDAKAKEAACAEN